MVCSDLIGGGCKNWSDSAKWLATIEVDHVKEWFETKRNKRRLGMSPLMWYFIFERGPS